MTEPIWRLRGYTSNSRYTTAAETSELRAIQADLGRPQATLAALIPIRKSDEWWQLAQDERRTILGEQSRHISIGLEYLPGVARRLYHCREFGEPFDFLTWFEYSAKREQRLRAAGRTTSCHTRMALRRPRAGYPIGTRLMNPARIIYLRDSRSRIWNCRSPGFRTPSDICGIIAATSLRCRAAPTGEPRSIRGRLTGSPKRLMLPAV